MGVLRVLCVQHAWDHRLVRTRADTGKERERERVGLLTMRPCVPCALAVALAVVAVVCLLVCVHVRRVTGNDSLFNLLVLSVSVCYCEITLCQALPPHACFHASLAVPIRCLLTSPFVSRELVCENVSLSLSLSVC